MKTLREVNRKRPKKFHIVSEKWVYDSIESGKLLKERDYEPAWYPSFGIILHEVVISTALFKFYMNRVWQYIRVEKYFKGWHLY